MPEHKPIIGLCGGIGSGKSTVARMMAERGAAVIDADALARRELESPEVRQQLIVWWGADVLDDAGNVDRRRVAGIVFEDEPQRERLEALVHPRVAARRDELIRAARADDAIRAIVLDAPLLLEVGLDDLCDRVVFVACDRQTRLERLRASRGWDEKELSRREKNQWSIDRKLQRATDIVDNTKGEPALRRQVDDLLDRSLNPH